MEKSKNNRKALLGLVILSIGALLLMDNLNVLELPIRHYIFSWKTLLIVIGLLIIVARQNLTGGIILMGLGLTFWLPAIFAYQFTLGQVFLPSMLVLAGVVVLLNTVFNNKLSRKHADKSQSDIHTIEVEPVE